MVSRDRANGFAEAIRQALPHATQVADRYHLFQNLRDHLQQFLDHKRTCLPLVEDTPADAKEGSPISVVASSPDRSQAPPVADLSNVIAADRKKLISRNKRLARYKEVMALYHKGVSQRDIARQLHLSRNSPTCLAIRLLLAAILLASHTTGCVGDKTTTHFNCPNTNASQISASEPCSPHVGMIHSYDSIHS